MRIDPKDVPEARLDLVAIKRLAEIVAQRITDEGEILGSFGYRLDLDAISALVEALRRYPVIETSPDNRPTNRPESKDAAE